MEICRADGAKMERKKTLFETWHQPRYGAQVD